MATTPEFKADDVAIAQKVNDFKTQHANLAAAIKQLKDDEDAMTNGSNWQGEARDAFNAFMERYYFQADKLNDKLMQTGEALGQMGNKFADQNADWSRAVQAQVSSLDLPPV